MLRLVKGRFGLVLGPPMGSKTVILRGRCAKNGQMAIFGDILGYLGLLLLILGPSWRHLGRSAGHLGAISALLMALLGPSWGHLGLLGAMLAALGPMLGRSWGHLGAPWRAILGPLRAFWGPSRVILESFWSHLEASWPVVRPS